MSLMINLLFIKETLLDGRFFKKAVNNRELQEFRHNLMDEVNQQRQEEDEQQVTEKTIVAFRYWDL